MAKLYAIMSMIGGHTCYDNMSYLLWLLIISVMIISHTYMIICHTIYDYWSYLYDMSYPIWSIVIVCMAIGGNLSSSYAFYNNIICCDFNVLCLYFRNGVDE